MPGKRVARPAKARRTRRLVALLVAALLVVGGVAYAVNRSNDGQPSAAPEGSGGTSTPSASGTASPSPRPSPSSRPSRPARTPTGTGTARTPALRSCATALAGAQQVVKAARPGVSDWSAHVQARTDMFAGRISVEEMDATWKRTRLAGPGDQQRFHAALRSYHAPTGCDHLGGVPQADRAVADRCVTRARAADRAVAAATAAMGDWKSHLDNMASYAHGGMSSAQAQSMWVSAWRSAPRNISAYEHARAALSSAPACRAPS